MIWGKIGEGEVQEKKAVTIAFMVPGSRIDRCLTCEQGFLKICIYVAFLFLAVPINGIP